MATRIFLSGGEVPKFRACMAEMKTKSILMTYWALRKNPDHLVELKEAHPEIDIMVDSGAFTLFQKDRQEPAFYEKYMDEYEKFLIKHQKHIFMAAELDLDTVIGSKICDKWRERFFEISKKVPIIFVWHPVLGVEKFMDYCRKYDLVGIGSDFNEDHHALMNIARKYLTEVHAFGFTASNTIQSYDFYSCDSTTWLIGSKYGDTNIFNGKTINRYDNKKKEEIRRTNRVKFQAAGLDWSKIEAEDYYEVIKMNMLSFIEMEDFLRRANASKAYWLKKAPRPSICKKMDDAKVTELLRGTFKLPEEYIQSCDEELRSESLYVISCLQRGRNKTILKYIKEAREDAGTIFGDELIAALSAEPTPAELDTLRTSYNMKLLTTAKPIARVRPEHFKPAFTIKRREGELEESDFGGSVPLSEEMDDLFYKGDDSGGDREAGAEAGGTEGVSEV